MENTIKIPIAFRDLFTPSRYKAYYSGRGCGKSQSFAIALLLLAAQKPLRILCTREIQKSIKDSVKRLIDDKIKALGLEYFFETTDTEVRGKNGSLFIFSGLKSNIDSIKSMEGVDIVWIEEASRVSQESLDLLIPTIRKEGSEIWFSWNPEFESDPVDKMFRSETPPPNAIVRQVTIEDNPFFPKVLREEMEFDRANDIDKYNHVWLGAYKKAEEGAYYADLVEQAKDRITLGLYDSSKLVYTAWDLGFTDDTAIIFYQKNGAQINIIDFYANRGKPVEEYLTQLQSRAISNGYRYANHYLPHDAFNKNYHTGKSTAALFLEHNYSVRYVANLRIQEGIQMARKIFPRVFFDKDKTGELINCLKNYQREYDYDLKVFKPNPLHNWASHACLHGDTEIELSSGKKAIKDIVKGEKVVLPTGNFEITEIYPTAKVKKALKITCSNGQEVIATADHPFLTERGLVRADALRYNDIVLTPSHWINDQNALNLMDLYLGYREAITGEIAGLRKEPLIYTEPSGNFTMGQSLRDTKFITKTKTLLITALKIWRLSKALYTKDYTCLRELERIQSFLKHPSKKQDSQRHYGIKAQKVKSFIKYLGSCLGRIRSGLNLYVKCARLFIQLLSRHVQNGVVTIVGKQPYAESGKGFLVYNMKITGQGAFSANGILVSNCDSFRYMAVSFEDDLPTTKKKEVTSYGFKTKPTNSMAIRRR